MRAPFLPRTPAPNPHPGVTTQPSSGSKGSISPGFMAGAAAALAGAAGIDGVAATIFGDWPVALGCASYIAVVGVIWRLWSRHQTAERWRQAIQRRDELKRQRADAVRLHRSVKHIDAELIPLVARMEANRI